MEVMGLCAYFNGFWVQAFHLMTNFAQPLFAPFSGQNLTSDGRNGTKILLSMLPAWFLCSIGFELSCSLDYHGKWEIKAGTCIYSKLHCWFLDRQVE
jgi:hypothetical protein